jgi:glycosyltransferase involved in cell wall biosynthesis
VTRPRILYVTHNHPSVRPGGAEAYALEVYEAMRDRGEFEPVLVAKSGPPMSRALPHAGTPLSLVGDDPRQYFMLTTLAGWDQFLGTRREKDLYVRDFREFLRAYRPDVVHFQHTLFLGYDLIREVRTTLPEAAIVYTLHELLPICHHQGQMVKTSDHALCTEASPARCHECFPEISPQQFFLRERFVKAHFSLVDQFITPSQFLLDRYAAWGIPREKILLEEYGREPRDVAVADDDGARPRTRIGFFGQLTEFKGIDVLLSAMILLAERSVPVRLSVHGANLELQRKPFREKVEGLVEASRQTVTLMGRYAPMELGRLMAPVDWVVVPSIWWENSPLVIQEAFTHRRPVITSDIGGMAEKVSDGVDGLHFRTGDPVSLADTIERATADPALWHELQRGIKPIYPMDQHLSTLAGLYRDLVERRAAVTHA